MRLPKTIIRIVNFFKLLTSYLFSILFHKPMHWGNPAFISIEPTNHCNLHCPECPTGQSGLMRPTGNLAQRDFERIIDQITPALTHLTLYFQGEPYLNTDIFNFISYARWRSIYVWSSTNGHFLTDSNIRKTIESGLNKLVISLDGTDQSAYEQYRIGGSFDKVVEGIRNLVWIRKEMGVRHPRIEIQFLVLKSNEHQVREIKNLGKSLGVDKTVLKTAQFNDFKHGNPLMPEKDKWSRYRKNVGMSGGREVRTSKERESKITETGTRVPHPTSHIPHPESLIPDPVFTVKNPLRNRCFRMWAGCVITWDGKVVPCCFDKDADHCMGDLKTLSFVEIWKGENYRRFRQTILRNRKSVDICRNCSQTL